MHPGIRVVLVAEDIASRAHCCVWMSSDRRHGTGVVEALHERFSERIAPHEVVVETRTAGAVVVVYACQLPGACGGILRVPAHPTGKAFWPAVSRRWRPKKHHTNCKRARLYERERARDEEAERVACPRARKNATRATNGQARPWGLSRAIGIYRYKGVEEEGAPVRAGVPVRSVETVHIGSVKAALQQSAQMFAKVGVESRGRAPHNRYCDVARDNAIGSVQQNGAESTTLPP
eukprot:scaffold2643_cov117-Isochrysis_galbana.AAC.5